MTIVMHGKFTILILAVLKWLAKYISNKDPITVNEHWLNSALLLSFLSRDFDLAILHTSCIKFFKRDLYTKWKPGFDSFSVLLNQWEDMLLLVNFSLKFCNDYLAFWMGWNLQVLSWEHKTPFCPQKLYDT